MRSLYSMGAALLLFLLMAGTSCTSIRELLGFGFEQPKVSLRSIEIKNISMTSVKMLVHLRIKNPNTFDLTLNRLDYKVTTMNMELAEGLFEKKFTVKAESQNDVEIPLSINMQSALRMLKTLVEEADKDHMAEIAATVVFDSPIGEIEHTFTDEKNLSKF